MVCPAGPYVVARISTLLVLIHGMWQQMRHWASPKQYARAQKIMQASHQFVGSIAPAR